MHKVETSPAAGRDLAKLSRRILRYDFDRLKTSVRGLATQPRPHGAQRLKSGEGFYRIRVGNYRIMYCIDDVRQLVTIARVLRRNEATYR